MTHSVDVLQKIVTAWQSFFDEVITSGVTRQQLARFMAGAAAGVARSAHFTFEEFVGMARTGWAAAPDPEKENKPS